MTLFSDSVPTSIYIQSTRAYSIENYLIAQRQQFESSFGGNNLNHHLAHYYKPQRTKNRKILLLLFVLSCSVLFM